MRRSTNSSPRSANARVWPLNHFTGSRRRASCSLADFPIRIRGMASWQLALQSNANRFGRPREFRAVLGANRVNHLIHEGVDLFGSAAHELTGVEGSVKINGRKRGIGFESIHQVIDFALVFHATGRLLAVDADPFV